MQWAPLLAGDDLKDWSRELEDLGYFSIGFPDHYFIGRDNAMAITEPFTGLAYVAACTSRIRLVTIVSCNDFRHPALFARAIATLDVLSGGRIEAGIGAGWYGPEYDAIGIPFDRPGIRIARLEEAIRVAKDFWTKESFSFEGSYYRIDDLPGLPRPIQEPHPPLMVGAGGDKMLRLAGREADVVGLTSSLRDFDNRDAMRAEMRPEVIERKVGVVRDAAREAGRDPSDLILQAQINTIEWEGEDPGHYWALTGDPERMMDELRSRASTGVTYHMLRVRDRDRIREFGKKVVSKL